MVPSGFRPKFLTVGPVAPRRFDADGRLVIFPHSGLPGMWDRLEHRAIVSHAASLALALDVFYKRPDLRFGGQYTFKLEEVRYDIHASWANYRIEVPIPLDWTWFQDHAAVQSGALERGAGPALWPRTVGDLSSQPELRDWVPAGFAYIRSTADAADPKWAAAGFRAGEPWDGTMPAMSRREKQQAFPWGYDRARQRWHRSHPDEAIALQ